MKCDVASIWDEHRTYMQSFIRRRIKDEALANDLLHDVLLRMCEFCANRNDVQNIRNWLYQITRNVIIDHFREERRKEKLSITPASQESFDEIVLEFIIPLINQLPEKYRVPLVWSDIDQIPQGQIAEKLSLSLSGAKSRVQRARKQLKQLFYECCYLETDHLGNLMDCTIKDTCTCIRLHTGAANLSHKL